MECMDDPAHTYYAQKVCAEMENEMKNKKFQRILALLLVAALVCLYLLTLIAALFDRSESQGLFKASVFCTIAVPVLLYVYVLIYRLNKK